MYHAVEPLPTRIIAYINSSSLFADLFPSSCHTIPVLAHLFFCSSSSNRFPHPTVPRWLSIFIPSFLTKIGKMQSAGCWLFKIAREARGESTDGLTDVTHGHINSVCCEGMATKVMLGCPPLHLEAPVWQHARCTKAKKQAQVCHAWQRK